MSTKKAQKKKQKITVRRSSAGLGLFAATHFERGDLVVEYKGPKLTDEEADEKGGKYLFAIDDELTIDGSSRQNVARYINHSCKPNCEAEIDGDRVFIYAKKNITPDDELSYNYGREYFKDYIEPYGCRCGHH